MPNPWDSRKNAGHSRDANMAAADKVKHEHSLGIDRSKVKGERGLEE
jgi:hypothetical protein